jgi:WXG100 family type VII secretion target
MAELKVTAAQLISKAEELQQLNHTFKAKVDALEETETSLAGMWDGDAKEAFHKAFMSDKVQMTNFYNAIAQYVSVMEQIAAKYNEAEVRNVDTASTRNY